MAQVKIGQFKFGEDVFTLRYVLDRDIVKFVAKDIANSLKHTNAAEAVRKHVDIKYKTTYEQGETVSHPASTSLVKRGDPLYLQPHTVLITKSGVIQLIMKSKLPYAVELQEWLLEEVIPQVLCTGKYNPAIKQHEEALRQQQEENKQLVTKLIATFSEHSNAMRQELVKKQDFIERVVAMKDKQIEAKDQQVTRVMTDLNRMYNGFQDTMQKKDEQVTKLVAQVIDLSGRAVQYPEDERKHPVLCVTRDGTTFTAIAGQKAYVHNQKLKRNLSAADIVAETTRPNPTVDWNNATHRLAAKKSKRSISFESEQDAQQFEIKIKQLLNNVN
ncbi:baculovirus repeated ORF-b [Anticarsia gemmatalis nucleopolyhedrovirus]|uniref:Baculovirus repeated ORF n=1 Tax=Anticarsia gemmatalis multiple nucleopolyhedrovirus TaxID=268591 RepID=A0A0S3J1K4_9ABAC|nr:baculovirus repeated ORF-b [Anticarsia gemmatalis nucleopolyhedrovirus]ABI13791.1 baculovirus repeated ORF-b [Anticarsia gemmatalis multiple nucleopolyhedrovirus]ALR69963.1 baculovirus repeated ORF [Anticarsia gemmatalis multiple nucleopolyhedrovirus]ALR70748.1 baculovirus repeated ORF [Anticarsia gemmatalis multiple nucleopolyhedrovirus]ALR71063.1 baculovirus repeated ORF [Anticarsia gemmatalis multiple nucleopolyhedrovirus]ALR71379.1 baculovirus repeated ORF [Anticarsia gemmatalis multipl